MSIVYTNNLDMHSGGVPLIVHLGQYDSDFSLVFNLYSSVGALTIESGTTAEIRGTKSDGFGYSADATIDIVNKKVTVAGSNQMTAAARQNIFELVLLKNNKVLSSANFILDVEHAALDADTIQDESVLKELNAIIEGAATATQAAEDAEDAADRAEEAADDLSGTVQQVATNTQDIANLKDDYSDIYYDLARYLQNRIALNNYTNSQTAQCQTGFKPGHTYKLIPSATTWQYDTPASGTTFFEITSKNYNTADTSLYKVTLPNASIDSEITIDVPLDSKFVFITIRAKSGTNLYADVIDMQTDTTLAIPNMPADARATGKAINDVYYDLARYLQNRVALNNYTNNQIVQCQTGFKPGHIYKLIPSATSWEYDTPASGTFFEIVSSNYDAANSSLYKVTLPNTSIDSEIIINVPSNSKFVFINFRAKSGTNIHADVIDLGESNYMDTYLPLANISVSNLNLFKRGEYVWYEGTKGSTKTPIVNARSIYDGGPAFADLSPIIYENGEPIIKDNKMYYAKTSYWQLGGTGCAVYEYDIGTGEFHLSGMIGGYEVVNGSETMYSIVATHIMYNRNTGEWQYTSTGAGDDSHTLHYSHSYNSPLHGCTILEFRKLTYANAQSGDEDGIVFYSDELQKWVLVYCKLVNNTYRVCLQTSDYCDDGFAQYSVNSNVTGTGTNVCKVNNTRYVLSGDTDQNGVNRYAVLSFPDLTFVCYLNLNYNNGGFRTWNTLIPVPDGEFTSYYLLTFDRAIQSPAWNWSYGNIYMYRAKERNEGLEYPLHINGQEVTHAIQNGTDIDDLHLQLLWAKPFVSNEEILLSEINLDNNVRRSNSNLYQTVGDTLEQINTGLVLTSSGEAKIYGGQHQPGAVYILPTKNIGKNDYRYIQICDYNGTVYLQVSVKGNREVYVKGYNYSETLVGSLSVDGELLIYTGGGKVNIYSRHSH